MAGIIAGERERDYDDFEDEASDSVKTNSSSPAAMPKR